MKRQINWDQSTMEPILNADAAPHGPFNTIDATCIGNETYDNNDHMVKDIVVRPDRNASEAQTPVESTSLSNSGMASETLNALESISDPKRVHGINDLVKDQVEAYVKVPDAQPAAMAEVMDTILWTRQASNALTKIPEYENEDQLASNEAQVSNLPAAAPGGHPVGLNHLLNGNFESTSGWSFDGPCTIISGNQAKEGSRCLYFPYKSSVGYQFARQELTLEPGKEYILSFYAKRYGRMDIWAGHMYYDSNGYKWNQVHGPSLLDSISDNAPYSRQEYRFTLPASASGKCYINLLGGNEPSHTGVSGYIDDVVLVRADGKGYDASRKLEECYVNVPLDSELNIRTAPNSTSPIVISLNRGFIIDAYATDVAGWAYIMVNASTTGYGQQMYLSKYSTYGALLGTRYVNTGNGIQLNVRSSESTSASVLFTLSHGEEVTAYLSGKDGWIFILTKANKFGYCEESFLSATKPQLGTPVGNRYIDAPIGYSMYVFAEPNTGSTRLCTLPRGALVKAYSVGNNDWLLIQTTTTSVVYEGYVGVMNLLEQPPLNGPNIGTRYVNCPAGYSIYLFKEANSSSIKRYLIARNTEVSAYDMGISGWKFVCTSTGYYGYCMDTYLSTTPLRNVTLLGDRYINSPIGYYKKIYAEPNTNTQKYSWIRNTHVKAYTIDVPDWVLVVNDSAAEGYMLGSGLSTTSLIGGAELGVKYVNCAPAAELPLYATTNTTVQPAYKLLHSTAVDCFDSGVAGLTFVRDRNTSLNPRPEGYCQSNLLSNTVPVDPMLYGHVIGGPLNLRASASTGAAVLTTIPSLSKITLWNYNADWYKAQYGSFTGYVMEAYVSIDGYFGTLFIQSATTFQAAGISMLAAAATLVPIYATESTSSNVVMNLAEGSEVEAWAAASNGWAKVKYNGITGYVQTSSLSAEKIILQSTMITAKDKVNFREKANTKAELIDQIPNSGTKVSVVGIAYNKTELWYKVEYKGSTGYILGTMLNEVSNPNDPGQKYVTTNRNNVIVRTGPSSTAAEETAKWPINRRVIVTEYDNEWYQTRYAGRTAYARQEYFNDDSTPVQSSIIARMAYIAEAEENQTISSYYDGYTGDNFCHAFVDWLAKQAGLNRSKIPNENGCAWGIIRWINELGGIGDGFHFTRDDYKQHMKTGYPGAAPDGLDAISNDLETSERNYLPKVGDYVYFKWSEEATGNIRVNHVGWIYKIVGDTIYTWEGNSDGGAVHKKEYLVSNRKIVGYGSPKY